MNTGVPVQQYSTVIKKSTFIALSSPCPSYTSAQTFLSACKSLHPKARHHCHAYLSHSPPTSRCSDDGEPTGTAGQPILSSLKKHNLTNVVVVVVRYSGGIKLGSGGLIRAYGGIASTNLSEATKSEIVMTKEIKVALNVKYVGEVYGICKKCDGEILEEGFDEGESVFKVRLLEEKVDEFKEELGDRVSGDVRISDVEYFNDDE
ncbi:hypothetical protein TrST_g1222 [Triparma strigata]|uniref:Impact N-terminal domain-containing protein n=1 Tax=Triparma strigata TaxID=1606541 RepID=A0A9W7AAF2_9STRA|nr:hypothetical protein TrST_g1222 [Triparma strigata]